MRKPNTVCVPTCPRRSPTCHGTCPDYAAERAQKDKERNERNKKAYAAWQLNIFEKDKHRRIKNSR